MTPAEMVREFMTAFGQPVATHALVPPRDVVALRVALVEEEAAELEQAIQRRNRVEVAGEAADLVYVAWGGALDFGVAPEVARLVREGMCGDYGPLADAECFREAAEGEPLDLAEVAMWLAFVIVAAYDAAEDFRVPADLLDEVIGAVHAANMRKVVDGVVLRRPDGKVTKPAGWVGADVAEVLARAESEAASSGPDERWHALTGSCGGCGGDCGCGGCGGALCRRCPARLAQGHWCPPGCGADCEHLRVRS